jgi:hypothetical protein
MPSRYTFDYSSILKIKQDHETLRQQVRQLRADLTQLRATQPAPDTAFFTVTTKIEPSDPEIASGSSSNRNIGEGKGTLMRVQKLVPATDYNFELIESDQTDISIFNFSKLPVPVGSIIQCFRLFQSKQWFTSNPNQTILAQAPSGGISARSGSTASFASCTVLYLSSGAITTTGETVRVYNWSQTAVAANAYITIKQVGNTSDWIVDAEDCTT